jgi:hypothetical protein
VPSDAWRRAWALAPRSKYGAQKVALDGLRFDSKREAARYVELKVLLACDLISQLEIQPAYPLIVSELYHQGPPSVFHTVGKYFADFRYLDNATGEIVVEDVKSKPTRTAVYRLKKRIVEAQHGVTIREID